MKKFEYKNGVLQSEKVIDAEEELPYQEVSGSISGVHETDGC